MRNKILVLGGAGFIGANVTHRLVHQGYDVRVFTRSSRSVQNLAPILSKIELQYGDYMDEVALRKAMIDVDCVIHLISTTLPGTSSNVGTYDIFSNVIPTLRILENCLNNNIKQLIYASSGGTIYGDSRELIHEDHVLDPKSMYGLSKKNIESYLNYYANNSNLNIQILRLSNPYGPYQNPYGAQGIIATAFRSILNNTPIQILGDGNVIRDYIYIDDVVDAFTIAMKQLKSNTINISSSKGRSVLNVLADIEQISGKKIIKEFLPARTGDVLQNVLDNRKANEQYHWTPKTSFIDGLAPTWKWEKKEISGKK